MQCDVDDVISRGIQATNKMIQVEAKKCELAKIKGVEKVSPSGRIRDVAVIRDERVIKVKRIVEGSAKQ